jgi:hypothetical protein
LQLGRAVEVDGAGGLVGRQRHDPLHAGVDGGVDDVLRAADVGLDVLERVVLGRVDLLEGGGVDDVVDVVERAIQTGPIADVADEEAQARVVAEHPAHLELLELVTAEDDETPQIVLVEQAARERLAE